MTAKVKQIKAKVQKNDSLGLGKWQLRVQENGRYVVYLRSRYEKPICGES